MPGIVLDQWDISTKKTNMEACPYKAYTLAKLGEGEYNIIMNTINI